MYGLELILIIFATLAQSLASDSKAISIVGVIVFWRVLMGIGIGGGKSDDRYIDYSKSRNPNSTC